MEAKQATEIVLWMRANWAHVRVDEATYALWSDHLREVPADEGKDAADLCIANLDHFPTVHEFIELWRVVKRRRPQLPPPPPQRTLDVPPTNEEQRASAAANIARLREQIRSVGKPPPDPRLTPEAEARAASKRPAPDRPPPEPCCLDDHRYCGTGPVLKRPTDPAVTPSTNPTKETP